MIPQFTYKAGFGAIFRSAVTKGVETQSVMEPSTVIAIIVYAIIGYGVVRLIKIYKAPKIKGTQ
jgi:hypothetical protein